MAQNSPNLLTTILGGSGVLGILTLMGGFAGFVVNKHVAAIEAEKMRLTGDNTTLRQSLGKAETDLKNAIDDVSNVFVLLEQQRDAEPLSSEDAARMKRILGQFQRLRLIKEFEEYKTAARWLNYRKSDWVKEAVRVAVKEHSKLIPRQVRKRFEQDIAAYLNWVCMSLYVYEHAKAPLSQFVSKPAIQNSFPYSAAIRYLKENRDRGELTLNQSRYLENMLDELLRKLTNEFKNL